MSSLSHTINEIKHSLKIFERISFVEENHQYKIDGKLTNCPSVTKLLKKFKEPFDKETVAQKVAKRLNVSTEQLLADWALNNLYSTTIGTMLHKYIENFYCKINAPYEGNFSGLGHDEKKDIAKNFPKLVKQFRNFHNDYSFLKCVKNEAIMGDLDDTNVCGMSDMLSYNQDTNELEILDFKTNKKMQKTTRYGNLLYPFEDMCVSEINEYTIQLNTYKYFVQKHTNLRIGKMRIIWFHSSNENYNVFELDNIQNKIEEMFNIYKRNSLFGNE